CAAWSARVRQPQGGPKTIAAASEVHRVSGADGLVRGQTPRPSVGLCGNYLLPGPTELRYGGAEAARSRGGAAGRARPKAGRREERWSKSSRAAMARAPRTF